MEKFIKVLFIIFFVSASLITPVIHPLKTTDAADTALKEKLLVVLVDFADAKIVNTDAYWNNYVFTESGKTVNAYYKEVSKNKFKFEAAQETYGTQNDGVVKVALETDNPCNTNSYTWMSFENVKSVLQKVNDYVNFAGLDVDNNGAITDKELHLLMVFANQKDNKVLLVQECHDYPRYTINNPNEELKLDGKYVWCAVDSNNTYNGDRNTIGAPVVVGEYKPWGNNKEPVIEPLGTLVHELGHSMAITDLYDGTGKTGGLGDYSVMSAGITKCVHFDAWSKAKMGFIKPTTAYPGLQYTVYAMNSSRYNILKIATSDPNQYFLVENRQLIGFDSALKTDSRVGGILVYHVDESRRNNTWAVHRVDIEEADEQKQGKSMIDSWLSGDAFYRVGNATIFAKDTIPNSNLNSTDVPNGGAVTGIKIEVLDQSKDSMRVKISKTK